MIRVFFETSKAAHRFPGLEAAAPWGPRLAGQGQNCPRGRLTHQIRRKRRLLRRSKYNAQRLMRHNYRAIKGHIPQKHLKKLPPAWPRASSTPVTAVGLPGRPARKMEHPSGNSIYLSCYFRGYILSTWYQINPAAAVQRISPIALWACRRQFKAARKRPP